MPMNDKVLMVLSSLGEIQACVTCETRLRFGDYECPHCGADLDDRLHAWAQRLVERITD